MEKGAGSGRRFREIGRRKAAIHRYLIPAAQLLLPLAERMKKIASNKRINLLMHIMLWVPSIIVPIVLMPMKDGSMDFSISKMGFTVLQIGIFYVMVYALYPRYFLQGKVKTYLLTLLGLCLANAVFSGVWHNSVEGGLIDARFFSGMAMKFFIGICVMGTGTAYLLIMDYVKEQRNQQENLKTELVFLRSQVSPHFMFNTLNSLVSLARKRSDKLEPALMELSNLLHYMLYESDEEKVSIRKEINYLQSYIDLQTLRFGHQVRILFTANEPEEHLCIEPMLLIPLVENAFKHGIGMIDDPEINIKLDVQKSDLLLFVKNKYNAMTVESKDRTSGIGLNNLERRLNLLYPGRHAISAVKNGQYFKASLKINLHDQVSGC